ncbi:hypothetical protein WJM97_22335 [Okeanomitos corallinicola TIOX110]|uniref:TMhelix containing protein n=1 Tax=Okeanomitos corallinicola TIOX110 TaxID=3133117 RepID=A0ABZ2URP6_9CYAN
MTTERATMLITILTIVTQVALFLVSGGFTVGGKLTAIDSEIKILRQEIMGQNQVQDYRIERLEGL